VDTDRDPTATAAMVWGHRVAALGHITLVVLNLALVQVEQIRCLHHSRRLAMHTSIST
jgi:hypothetical protein